MKRFLYLLSFFAISVYAEGKLAFSNEVYQIGKMKQGETRHIVLDAKNTGDVAVHLETAMTQGVGGSDFKFPKKIMPGESFKVEFNLSTAYAEGFITHTIVLVSTNGDAYTATLEGEVMQEFIFSEQLLDAGYYSPGEKREWVFYVWKPDSSKPSLKLSKDASKDFKASFTPVMLNTEKLDDIREGGKTPGIKVTLSTKGISKANTLAGQKSLRRIVGFESATNANAHPEILVIGYWK
jgi:hypothetical protein